MKERTNIRRGEYELPPDELPQPTRGIYRRPETIKEKESREDRELIDSFLEDPVETKEEDDFLEER